MFLPPSKLGMIVDYTPATFPNRMRDILTSYGEEMWCFRERKDGYPTTRAVNRYKGDDRLFVILRTSLPVGNELNGE
jgi:hypothetical protein